jgi:hypothetical protein
MFLFFGWILAPLIFFVTIVLDIISLPQYNENLLTPYKNKQLRLSQAYIIGLSLVTVLGTVAACLFFIGATFRTHYYLHIPAILFLLIFAVLPSIPKLKYCHFKKIIFIVVIRLFALWWFYFSAISIVFP